MSANQRCHVCWKTGEPGHECPSCDKPECPFAERDRRRREMFARFTVDAAKPGPLAKPISKREAYRQALLHAAGIIDSQDLTTLFADVSDEHADEESWARLEEAQGKVVALLRKTAGDGPPPQSRMGDITGSFVRSLRGGR